MASPREKAGSAVSVRLPVELWWQVIETLAASSEQFELMYVREVSRTFTTLLRNIAKSIDLYRHVRRNDYEAFVPVKGLRQPNAFDQWQHLEIGASLAQTALSVPPAAITACESECILGPCGTGLCHGIGKTASQRRSA